MFQPRSIATLLTLIVLGSASARSEIVDTLSGFDAEATGWSGALGASLSASGGNTDVVSYEGDLRLQWQAGAERIRALGSGSHERADGRRVSEEAMGHLRHNHRLSPWLRTLEFVQVQENPFQRLRVRTLVGAGVRIEPARRESVDVAFGVAHMLELEQLEDRNDTTTEHRLSTFFTVSATLREGVVASGSAFVQPRWDAFDDVRVSSQASLRSRVVWKVSLVLTGTYAYDAEPPEDVDPEDWEIETGLSLEL